MTTGRQRNRTAVQLRARSNRSAERDFNARPGGTICRCSLRRCQQVHDDGASLRTLTAYAPTTQRPYSIASRAMKEGRPPPGRPVHCVGGPRKCTYYIPSCEHWHTQALQRASETDVKNSGGKAAFGGDQLGMSASDDTKNRCLRLSSSADSLPTV